MSRNLGTRERFALAVALALALHLVLAAFVRPAGRSAAAPEPSSDSLRITIARRTPPPTPAPTPKPTARPTPVPARTDAATGATAAPRVTLAPRVATAAPHVAAPAPRATPRPVHVPKAVAVKPASGSEPAAFPGNGAPGSGTQAGGGNGDAGPGPGNGASTTACGSVFFTPLRTETAADGSQRVLVEIQVEMEDGSTSIDVLGWPFVYASAADNPFNTSSSHKFMAIQLPPSGYDLARQKPGTIYAVQHSTPDGHTTLQACGAH